MIPPRIHFRHVIAAVLVLVTNLTNIHCQYHNNDISRSIYLTPSSHMKQGGWRPIMASDSMTSFKFANIMGQKMLTGPSQAMPPHYVSVSPFSSAEMFGKGGFSTSTRPLVTRDVNKMTTQPYKSSMFPPNSPVSSYMNPFALPTGPGVSTYKLPPGYQFDASMYVKHQPMTHRPVYKAPQQMMLGKRIKPNQMMQYAANNYHHQAAQFQNNYKNQRPIQEYKRPVDNFQRPNNFQVNPQESLLSQTKSKVHPNQNVAAVTYKPALNPHFQNFGIQEEPFGPIPSSILGSFSSFGHASVKARDQVQPVKVNYVSTTTTTTTTTTTRPPPVSTQTFPPSSTYSTITNYIPTQETKYVKKNVKQQNIRNTNDDFTNNLVPPPKVISLTGDTYRHEEGLKHGMRGNFIPSPPDPLSKYQNAPEIKPLSSGSKQSSKYVYNTNLGTKRPDVTSFFESGPSVSTVVPLDAQSTNVVPDKLLVQVPPPYTTISSFANEPVKYDNGAVKENYHIHHGKPAQYNDDFKYFAPTRGQELFGGSKYVKYNEANTRVPTKASYEVTETWSSSGEINTQPTLHTWINKPAQSYKHYNIDLKPPPPPFKLPSSQDNRLFPVSFPPGHRIPDNFKVPQVTTTFSSISEEENKKHNDFYSQLENTLANLADFHTAVGDETHDLAAPFNISNLSNEEKPQVSSTPIYEEVHIPSRRKPSRNRFPIETTTSNSLEDDPKDFTTKYETLKETTHGVENDVQTNELPTIPPNKHFKRPVTTTPIPIETLEEKLRKRNKNRRRRPIAKLSTTTEEPIRETAVYTDHPIRSSKFRTTTLPSETEPVTRPFRPRVRLPNHKLRLTTKPTSQPELTSSAQPTMLPTAPVTLRPKLHSRIRFTTLSPLDFEDLSEITTPRDVKSADEGSKQSSIMKIAKDTHSHRFPSIKPHLNFYDTFNETPDYSHKQDEKDTPTSDIFINTREHKYSAQKNQQEDSLSNVSSEDLSLSELNSEQSSQEPVQTTRFAEQKLGNRGSTKVGGKSSEQFDDNSETTTPLSATKSHRLKLKPGKYETNRPRFSVKDYRNRLNQLSTSTEKPATSSESPSLARLRFPNRSRFPSFKDQHLDSKLIGSEISSSTELPRKKFTPKDPRHKDINNEEQETEDKTESIKAAEPNENEIKKPLMKLRNGLRRDPNRIRTTSTTTTTTTLPPVINATTEAYLDLEISSSLPINSYSNIKRPAVGMRKRLPIKNETSEEVIPEHVSTSTEVVITISEAVESSTEKHTSETAIMKIAKDERKTSNNEEIADNSSMDQSMRVSDLTLASSKEYNTPGLFKSVSPNSRKVPNYFTIATDDPILPIEAFFPQLNQKKES